jgi:ribosomal protein S12 methylthiotransferase accessory factor
MFEANGTIAFLEKNTLISSTLEAISPDSSLLGWRSRLRMFLLRILCNISNGFIGIYRLQDSLLAEKRVLQWLLAKQHITSSGEGVVYSDYPPINFFGISSLSPSGKQLRSWGYSLPSEGAALAINKAFWETLEREASFYTKKPGHNVVYPIFSKGDSSSLFTGIPKFTTEQVLTSTSLVSTAEDLKSVTGLTATSITGGRAKFLPADCFFWGEQVDPTQKKIHDVTTNGSGGGVTKEGAVLSGLYELIERDAFLLLWFSGVKPRIIDLAQANGPLFTHIEEAKSRYKLEVYFFDTTYDVAVPTAICFIIDPILNFVALGGKASSSGENTLKGSYLEALATLNLVRARDKRVPEEMLRKIIEQKTWGDPQVTKSMRVNLYNSPLGVETLRSLWLKDNQSRISFADFARTGAVFADNTEELAALLRKQKSLVAEKGDGYHAYVHYFASTLLEQFDYHVAHVFVPSLLKLHLSESLATPCSDRVFAYAHKYGKSATNESDLNPLPHPFP